MKNKILLALGVLLAVVFVSNQLASGPAARRQPAAAAQSTPATSEEKDARQAAQEIASQVRTAFDDNFPHQNEVSWDWETRALTVDLWPSFFGAREANAALQNIKYLNQWTQLLESLQETAVQIDQQFEAKGIPEATVQIDLYDNIDFSLLLASVSADGIEYDIVDSTPAGQQIGQSGDVRSLGVSYVVNTSSKVFHLPGCGAVSQIDQDNRRDVTSSREELIAQGYDPCGRCTP